MAGFLNSYRFSSGGVTPAKIEVVQFDTRTSTGTQDVTHASLGGLTPKAAFFIPNNNATGGGASNGLRIGVAASDGSSDFEFSTHTQNGQATTTVSRRGRAAQSGISFRQIFELGGTLYDGTYSFITDGIRLNYSTTSGTARRWTAILFAGDSLQAKVGTVALGSSATTIDVNDVGFQPDVVLFFGHNDVFDDTTRSNYAFMVGVASADGSQRSLCHAEANGQTDGAPFENLSTSAALHQFSSVGLSYSGVVGSFDSQGFSVAVDASAGGDEVGYIALKGVSAKILDLTTPTSTGSLVLTGAGFQPTAGIAIAGSVEAANAVPGATSSQQNGFGVGLFTATDQWSTATRSNSGSATTSTSIYVQNKAVATTHNTTTGNVTATLTSFDADGMTFNFDAVAANAKKGFVVALG